MIIEIKNLSKIFDSKEVLNIPELQVVENQIVGIIGNNGAGKTTLFRLILNLLRATSGYVLIQQQPVYETDGWKNITGSFLDERFLIEFLTPEEYFYYIGEVYGIPPKEVDIVLMDFLPLMADEILRQKKIINKFSKGNKQKIGIIGAMLIRPKLLILDEPFNFLDPSSQIIMKRLLQECNRKYGTTVLLSSHNLQHVMDICSRIIVLESGHIIRDEINPDNETKQSIENYFENKR
jgi:ABC-2 type transport system ATP-binding protein